ncbi:hypothetical protein [Hydrogenivirga sp. 128-5-R1-1]|uniref:hypothetical protein n=1 Tax=Hydrogenivirga sp. 128-5-R1-1 TaxID=392423 RepID=UPI00015EF9F5|nr:hypothetical protein [Hydrogenivirga sp. 128-5-R1-1]EDP75217.1 hypothetical protein HG1285_00595 [Hydrogenivirga sp. 128-5-R1-1]
MRKALASLIDISKAITAGLFIASVVSLVIQENQSGWLLFGGFIVAFILTMKEVF